MYQAEAKQEDLYIWWKRARSMSQILENHLSELTIVKLTVKARIKFYLEVLGFPLFLVIPKHM